jgi:hypothetical protein
MSRPVSQRFARIVLFGAPFAAVAFSAYVAMAQKAAVPPPPVTTVSPGTFRSVQPAPVVPTPVPIQSVVSFESAFVSQLNAAIRNPQALTQGRPRVVVIIDHMARKGIIVDKGFIVIESATVMKLSTAQIQEMRDSVLRSVDVAVQAELAGKPGLRALGGATISGGNVTGTINDTTTNRTLTGGTALP